MDGWTDGWKYEKVFVVSQMYGWMDSASFRYRKDGRMD